MIYNAIMIAIVMTNCYIIIKFVKLHGIIIVVFAVSYILVYTCLHLFIHVKLIPETVFCWFIR